jgi:transposase-like protein
MIQHAVCLYLRYTLNLSRLEELLAHRGLDRMVEAGRVSFEGNDHGQ